MRPSGVLESALYCDDLDAVEAFYRDVLGLELIARDPERHVFFRCGQGVVLIFDPRATMEPETEDSGITVGAHGCRGDGHLAFRATPEELEAWKARLVEAGVAIEHEVTWPGGARSIYFRDPAGNSLEFATPDLWGFEE